MHRRCRVQHWNQLRQTAVQQRPVTIGVYWMIIKLVASAVDIVMIIMAFEGTGQ